MNTATSSIEETVITLSQDAYQAALSLGKINTPTKNKALQILAQKLISSTDALLVENEKDLQAGKENGLSDAMIDRLAFTPERVQKMATGVEQIIALPDPVGELLESYKHPQGMTIDKVRVPLGVIGIIYESRPNVTIDCAALCLKSGNATILRGGKEAFHSNYFLMTLIQDSLEEAGIAREAVQLIPTTDRAAMNVLLEQDKYLSCIIPRGGEGLIRFVSEHSRVPVIKHYTGVCNAYIDAEADLAKAISIVVNAKCQRPGVCNAIENLFVHEKVSTTLLPEIARALHTEGVLLKGDQATCDIFSKENIPCELATEEDYAEEFLDKIISIKVEPDMQAAIDDIHRYGSSHSETIITENKETAEAFLNAVDSATVYWNVSTRFTDGFEFGLGAEIGISTDKVHARGPMGLRELTSYKFIIRGDGQIRS